MKSSRLQGYILIAIASIILGSNGIFTRFVNLPSPVLLFYRFLFGTIILLSYFLIRKRKLSFSIIQRKEIVSIGIIITLLSVLAFYAFANTSIAHAEILLFAYPLYVIILGPLLLKEKIEKSTVLYIILSFIGLILIASSNNLRSLNQNMFGIIAGFIAGILFAIYMLLAKMIRNKIEGLELNLYSLIISVFLLFPFLFIFQYTLDFLKIILLAVMGLFHSALALSFYYTGVKMVKAQHVGIISYFEPLSAVIFALLIFGEIPSIYTLIGGGLIIYSGYKIVSWRKDK